MICRLRSFFLLLIVFVVSAPFSRAQQGGTTRIEETDPSITYSGTWFTNGGENNSGGSAALTNSTGARAVVTFTGTGISWIGVGDRWNGLATVTLDGQPSKVDGWAETTAYQMVLYSISGLSVGPHKLSIEINHERGPNGEGSWVWIDAFDIQNGKGLSGGVPTDKPLPFWISNASIQTQDPSPLGPLSWLISIESLCGPTDSPLML